MLEANEDGLPRGPGTQSKLFLNYGVVGHFFDK